MDYVIKSIHGHIEVYDTLGHFVCSADTVHEALQEIKLMEVNYERNHS